MLELTRLRTICSTKKLSFWNSVNCHGHDSSLPISKSLSSPPFLPPIILAFRSPIIPITIATVTVISSMIASFNLWTPCSISCCHHFQTIVVHAYEPHNPIMSAKPPIAGKLEGL